MRPKRNRGESHKKNVLSKYIIKFIADEKFGNYIFPVICKKGSYDPRTGGAWPEISKKEKYLLKELFKIAKPRYYIGWGEENNIEYKKFIELHLKNKYTIINSDMCDHRHYANVNPFQLILEKLIDIDLHVYWIDDSYNHYWSWEQNDYNYPINVYNQCISTRCKNLIKNNKNDKFKERHNAYKYGKTDYHISFFDDHNTILYYREFEKINMDNVQKLDDEIKDFIIENYLK